MKSQAKELQELKKMAEAQEVIERKWVEALFPLQTTIGAFGQLGGSIN